MIKVIHFRHFTPTENIVTGECLEVEGDTSNTLAQTEMHMSKFLNGSNSETKNENDMSVGNVNKGVSEKLSKYLNTSKDAVMGVER